MSASNTFGVLYVAEPQESNASVPAPLTREERGRLDRKEARSQTLSHLVEALLGASHGGRLPWRIRLHWLAHPFWVYRSCKHVAESRSDLEAMGWREIGYTTMEDM